LGAVAWQSSRSREPVYQGKPLSYWLGGYDHPPRTNVTIRQANDAVRQLGTNAFPMLFRRLQQPDSEFRSTIMMLLQKQHVIKVTLGPRAPGITAMMGFNALGSQASNAVPRLIEIFDSDPSAFTQQGVPVILGHIGPPAAQAIPALLRGMTHTNAVVRNNSIFAVRLIHAAPEVVVPALIRCLNDPDPLVRGQAVRALGTFGKEAQLAVPGLLELWRKAPPTTSSGGTVGFPQTMVSSGWASIPLLLGSGSSPDLREATQNALKDIDPEAAAKAGVQ
jgi:hypothetical protein